MQNSGKITIITALASGSRSANELVAGIVNTSSSLIDWFPSLMLRVVTLSLSGQILAWPRLYGVAEDWTP